MDAYLPALVAIVEAGWRRNGDSCLALRVDKVVRIPRKEFIDCLSGINCRCQGRVHEAIAAEEQGGDSGNFCLCVCTPYT